jgi:CBS-domain-containing membrane protein
MASDRRMTRAPATLRENQDDELNGVPPHRFARYRGDGSGRRQMRKRIEAKLVGDVMTRHPMTVRPDTSLHELKRLFEVHDFNAFPVVDDAHHLHGIVTKLDLLRPFRHDPRRLLPDLSALWAEHVKDIMRRGVVTLSPGDPVAAAIDRMLATRLRSLPVAEHRGRRERLVGIVTRTDVLACLTIEDNDVD